jgi:hypothetical protein
MVYLIIVLAVLARFIPHLHNFSPVYGALLFGGAHLRKRDSVWFPVILLVASDIVLTNFVYHLNIGWMELFQAAAFASIALVGWFLRWRVTVPRFFLASYAGTTAFYLISNFGVWLGWRSYPPTWAGLIECYIAGIPYYGRTLASTLLFGAVLFGAYEFWSSKHAMSESQSSG